MKKYTAIVLMLLLCFTLLGCEKPQEPVGDTPVVDDTQAPETVTPNEVVTPNEPEAPTEPETPVEPETPTEPVEPEQPEENVIMLPEADENTKYITIDFPEVFPEEPYTEPNLVSPEEFDWGEYVPFVITLDQAPISPPVFSIISSTSPTLDEGIELYKKLNDKYLEVYNGEKLPDWYADEMTDELSDYLYKSRVVYVSPEADIIGRFKLIPKNDYPSKNRWSGQYDIFLNGEIEHTFFHNDILDNLTIGSFSTYSTPIQLYFYDKTADNITINYESKTLYNYYPSDKTKETAFEDGSVYPEENRIFFLSQDKSRITHIINYDTFFTDPQNENNVYSITLWLQDGDVQIVEFCNMINNYYTQAVYSLNINTGELTYLESAAYVPSLSPDGKYLIYFNCIGGEVFEQHTNPLPEKTGMYIKNLETGTTVNYPISRWKGGGLISWVNEEKLMELINEPEAPIEPEQPEEQPEENVIMLPEADENTIYFKIEAPTDFEYNNYADFKEVSYSEFDWGEYIPFVKYSIDLYGEVGSPLYAYSFLGSHATTILDGREPYKKLNEKYLSEYQVDKSVTLDGSYVDWENEEYINYFFKSRIVYLSEDLDRIGVFHLLNCQNEKEGVFEFWKGKFELYDDTHLIYSKNLDSSPVSVGCETGLYNVSFTSPTAYYEYLCPIKYADKAAIQNNTGLVMYNAGNNLYVYSTESNKLLYVINNQSLFEIDAEGNNGLNLYGEIEQIIDSRYILISFATNGYGNSYKNLYLYDLKTGEKERIANYVFEPKLSPDRQYLIFTPFFSGNTAVNVRFDESLTLKDGYYIVNLKNKEMVFYPSDKNFFLNTISWVNEEKLMELIEE